MDDRTKRTEGRDKVARVADVGTEPKKLSAQGNGLLASASMARQKKSNFLARKMFFVLTRTFNG